MASVLVIGGGIAGLSCAWRLHQARHDVEILEQAAEPGGRAAREWRDGYLLESGARFVPSASRHVRDLTQVLGLTLQPSEAGRTAILRGGSFERIDFESPLEAFRSRLVAGRGRVGLARLAFEIARYRRDLDIAHPERSRRLDRGDFATHLGRSIGNDARDDLIAPVLEMVLGSPPASLSRAYGLLALRWLGEGSGLETMRGGFARLAEALAERVRIRHRCEVLRVDAHEGGVRVRYRTPQRERLVLADAAVMAVPGPLVPRLCPRLEPAERGFFDAIGYSRAIVVHLLFDRAPDTLPCEGLAIARSASETLSSVHADHLKAGSVPRGAGLVTCVLTPGASERSFELPDAEIEAMVLGALAGTPVGKLQPQQVIVRRIPMARPEFRPGVPTRLSIFRDRRERTPRLAFAGDYLVGPHLEGALVSGLRAASEIAEQFREVAPSGRVARARSALFDAPPSA